MKKEIEVDNVTSEVVTKNIKEEVRKGPSNLPVEGLIWDEQILGIIKINIRKFFGEYCLTAEEERSAIEYLGTGEFEDE